VIASNMHLLPRELVFIYLIDFWLNAKLNKNNS
jgi:hypothetical protein